MAVPTVLYLGPDAPGTADVLRRELGATVLVERTAAAALDALDDAACLVVEDELPDADPLATIETVREARSEIPVFLLVGAGDESFLRAAYQHGVTDCLPRGGEDWAPALVARVARELPEEVAATEDGGVASLAPVSGPAAFHASDYRALADAAADGIVTIDADSVVRFANPAVEELFGYAPDEIVGESLTVLMSDDMAARHREGVEHYLATGERRLDWHYLELEARHRDGYMVPIGVSFGTFERGGQTFFTGIVRDITDRKVWEEKLAALNDVAGELAERSDADAIAERGATAALGILDPTVAIVANFDEDAGALRPRKTAGRDEAEAERLFGAVADLAWESFATGELLARESASGVDSSAFPSALVAPLGRHGVLVVLGRTADAFDEGTAQLGAMLADRLHTAFDRVLREEALRERNDALAEQNERLERVNRINNLIRELARTLTRASSREEVETAVCTELTASDPYVFAWIGEYDPPSVELTPRAWGGRGKGYLEEITVTVDDSPTGQGPAGRAAAERSVQVMNNALRDPPFEPWRQAALERGFRASAAVPLVHGDTLYGVLNLYAAEPGVFDQTERDVLAEVGEMIGYAIHSMEQRRALVDETATELRFAVNDSDVPIVEFVQRTGARFDLRHLHPREEGSLRIFFTVEGAAPDEVRAFFESVRDVSSFELVSSDGDGDLYECEVSSKGPVAAMLELGAIPRSISGEDARASFTVELPRSANLRRFVEALRSRYTSVDLLARRELDRPVRTAQEFRQSVRERLTDRQERSLEAAYWSGYFDTPRRQTGQDIAETLGISQPTFNRHLRAAEQRVFALLLEDGDGAVGGGE